MAIHLDLGLAPEILRMNSLDLARFVSSEIVENPMLDATEESHEFVPDYSNVADATSFSGDLRDYVLLQLRETCLDECLDECLMSASEEVLSYLNDNGYLEADLALIWAETGIPIETLESAIRLIQAQDPPGVGSANLAECLSIQLERRGLAGSLAAKIVKNHLEELGSGRLSQIARSLSVPLSQVRAAETVIRSLEPKPGRVLYQRSETKIVVTEASVIQVPDQSGISLVVVMNDNAIPELRMSPFYLGLLEESPPLSRVRAFLEERMWRASWLLRNLEHRRSLLYRIIELICSLRRDFFICGKDALRKISETLIAARLGLDERIVSCAVASKSILTPYGAKPLGYFVAR